MRSRYLLAAAFIGLVLAAGFGRADEGMWLYNNPPLKYLKDRYGFEPAPQWLEHLQKSSVRVADGGSASFVSPNGLVMTNHHVGSESLAKLSTKDRDLLKVGFYARTQAEELKVPALEFNVLMKIEDVTERVNAAVKPGMSPAEAQKARVAVINTIEKEAQDRTGFQPEIVKLYQGGAYHLYLYKKYNDIRLVFAPEQDIAFFGGDPDNFEYPRYDLDVCFFRVYENDKPAKVEHYLKWTSGDLKEGDLTFVSGHPGRTDRLNTVAHLEFLRDKDMPFRLNLIRRREVVLTTFSTRSIENARRAKDDLFTYQNSRKARLGMLATLQDPAAMGKKRADEKALRAALAADAKLREQYGDAWDLIEKSMRAWNEVYYPHYLLERGAAFNSVLFNKARALVRLAEEKPKPNAERLREYSEAALDTLKEDLLSTAPIYEDLEAVTLADSLSMLAEVLGGDQPLVQKILAGKSPQERASELVRGTRLKDVSFRKQLLEGGAEALKSADDPMINLARLVDGPARDARKRYEETVEEPQRQGYAKIANAKFAIHGQNIYPDATFTLRLAFGEVKGYAESGQKVPAFTTLGGTFEHAEKHGYKEPFDPPKVWKERKGKLDLSTPYNFVSTADIIGGNSGSPVVNRRGELVGIIFDGNIQSLALDYLYTDEQARAVSVDARAIIEALRKIYDAGALADELQGK